MTGLNVTGTGTGAEATWNASAEKGVKAYLVTFTPSSTPGIAGMTRKTMRVTEPRAMIPSIAVGTVIMVKAVDDKCNESWDWARAVVK